MPAFHEDRVLGNIVEALQRLSGPATLDEIGSQMARSGAMRLPPSALAQVVSLTIHQNVDGRGMGKFARRGPAQFELTSVGRGPVGSQTVDRTEPSR